MYDYIYLGFIAVCDGTLIGLRRAPAFEMFPETYHHHRHGGYGFNVLFWVDHHDLFVCVAITNNTNTGGTRKWCHKSTFWVVETYSD